jgi:hypothetical protein
VSISYLWFDPILVEFDNWGSHDYNVVYGLICATLGLLTISVTILVLVRLRKKSTSPELRKIVFRRHIIYAYFYLLSTLQIMVHFLKSETKDIFGMSGYNLLESIFDGLGIVMALIRLQEPFVWQEFKRSVAWLFCCRSKTAQLIKGKKKFGFFDYSLDQFLRSQLNTEFVYLILLGINSHLDIQTTQIKDEGARRSILEKRRDKINVEQKDGVTKVVFTEITIQNAKQLNIYRIQEIESDK